MTDEERLLLIEQATTAWRPRDRTHAVCAHPAFADLDAGGRAALHDAIERQRQLEAALDPDELSTTARAVLVRIRRG
jgi:hypothetical protein